RVAESLRLDDCALLDDSHGNAGHALARHLVADERVDASDRVARLGRDGRRLERDQHEQQRSCEAREMDHFREASAPALMSAASPAPWKNVKPGRSFHASGPPSLRPALSVSSLMRATSDS